jgi:hypothetical protein
MKTIRLTITGEQGSGKSWFVEKVLLPALIESKHAFQIYEGDCRVHASGGKKLPSVAVLVTNDPYLAVKHASFEMPEKDDGIPLPPIPMLLWCPECGERHIDKGEFETKRHHTHGCQRCGMVWRPAMDATVGVDFLPGFKDAP